MSLKKFLPHLKSTLTTPEEYFKSQKPAIKKRYGAMHDFFANSKPAEAAAGKFGHAANSFYSLAGDFRKRLKKNSGEGFFFKNAVSGRKPKKDGDLKEPAASPGKKSCSIGETADIARSKSRKTSCRLWDLTDRAPAGRTGLHGVCSKQWKCWYSGRCCACWFEGEKGTAATARILEKIKRGEIYMAGWKKYSLQCYCAVMNLGSVLLHENLWSKKKRNRAFVMSDSEVITIMALFHQSHCRGFKYFYVNHIQKHCTGDFTRTVSYNRFVELQQKALLPVAVFLRLCCPGKCTFIDSMPIRVCHIKREKSHKVFNGLATRGKSTIGWFFGFKLHPVINDKGGNYQIPYHTSSCWWQGTA